MIWRVGIEDIDQVWEKALALLEPALRIDNCSTPETLKNWLLDGTYQLWIDDRNRAAATTCIDVYPAKKVCTVVHLGGFDMHEWLFEGIAAIEKFARKEDCDLIRINGRREWSRVLGYRETAVISERAL